MKKSCMLGAVCASYFLLAFSTSSNADLVNESILSIDAGSNFELDSTGITPIFGNDGLIVGTSQFASGSHSGLPNGSENPGIDNPWDWLGNTGMHLTTSPTVILNDDGAGNVLLDFSGWEWTWNLQTWNLGSGAWDGNPNGVALMTCANDCANGDAYALTYSATFPTFPGGLEGIQYRLSLNGVISSVPVPAAVWLFGSGLLGLIGIARRKKTT